MSNWYEADTAAEVTDKEWEHDDSFHWQHHLHSPGDPLPPSPADFSEMSVCDGCLKYVSDYELVPDCRNNWFCEDCVESGMATEMGVWETDDDFLGGSYER